MKKLNTRFAHLFSNSGMLGILAALLPAAAHAGVTFDMMHTVQDCKHEGMPKTWCEGKEDMIAMDELSGMSAKIAAQLDRALANPKTAKVSIAYFSFSNKKIQKKLCEVGMAGIPVEAYIDAGSVSPELQALKTDCQKDKAKPNLKLVILGGMTSTPWRLHHNKTMMVDPGNGEYININFSSGNLSAFGTSIHLDHWGVLTATPDTNLVKAQRCVFEGLTAADAKATEVKMYEGGVKSQFDGVVAQAYIDARESCYVNNAVIPMYQAEKAIAKDGVAPMYSPNNNNEVVKTFTAEIAKVAADGKNGYLYIAVQHFLHGGIAAALMQAAQAGVDVRIIFDDDLLTGEGEVEGVQEFLASSLQHPNIKIRYIKTNYNAGGNGQMMHNKFCILSGKRTFSGAGQYTGAAMRNNWENFYLAQSPELTKKYGLYFKDLWDASWSDNDIKTKAPVASKPEAYHAKFLGLIK